MLAHIPGLSCLGYDESHGCLIAGSVRGNLFLVRPSAGAWAGGGSSSTGRVQSCLFSCRGPVNGVLAGPGWVAALSSERVMGADTDSGRVHLLTPDLHPLSMESTSSAAVLAVRLRDGNLVAADTSGVVVCCGPHLELWRLATSGKVNDLCALPSGAVAVLTESPNAVHVVVNGVTVKTITLPDPCLALAPCPATPNSRIPKKKDGLERAREAGVALLASCCDGWLYRIDVVTGVSSRVLDVGHTVTALSGLQDGLVVATGHFGGAIAVLVTEDDDAAAAAVVVVAGQVRSFSWLARPTVLGKTGLVAFVDEEENVVVHDFSPFQSAASAKKKPPTHHEADSETAARGIKRQREQEA